MSVLRASELEWACSYCVCASRSYLQVKQVHQKMTLCHTTLLLTCKQTVTSFPPGPIPTVHTCCASGHRRRPVTLLLNHLLATTTKMKAGHTALLAIRLLFIAYILCPALMNANRTTLLLAQELLCAAELFSQSLILVLERINDILGPSTHSIMLNAIARVVLPLIINLHFMHCFLRQLLPDTPAIGNGKIAFGMMIALWIIGLLNLGLMLGVQFFLTTRAQNLEDDGRRRLEKLVFISLTLSDIFGCLGMSSGSQLLSKWILVAVPLSGFTLEASIQESMDRITVFRMLLGLMLELQQIHMGELVVDVLARLVLVAVGILW